MEASVGGFTVEDEKLFSIEVFLFSITQLWEGCTLQIHNMKTSYSKKPKQQQQQKNTPSNEDLVTKGDIFKNFELQQKRIVFFPFIRGIS